MMGNYLTDSFLVLAKISKIWCETKLFDCLFCVIPRLRHKTQMVIMKSHLCRISHSLFFFFSKYDSENTRFIFSLSIRETAIFFFPFLTVKRTAKVMLVHGYNILVFVHLNFIVSTLEPSSKLSKPCRIYKFFDPFCFFIYS